MLFIRTLFAVFIGITMAAPVYEAAKDGLNKRQVGNQSRIG